MTWSFLSGFRGISYLVLLAVDFILMTDRRTNPLSSVVSTAAVTRRSPISRLSSFSFFASLQPNASVQRTTSPVMKSSRTFIQFGILCFNPPLR